MNLKPILHWYGIDLSNAASPDSVSKKVLYPRPVSAPYNTCEASLLAGQNHFFLSFPYPEQQYHDKKFV